jgi:thioredoxin-dependent peroxiredoxin
MLNVNNQAPLDVEVADQDGNSTNLRKVIRENPDKLLVLYFYPKDDTPGCTTEACNFRDDYLEYARHGALVIGVSKDLENSHQKFSQKYRLPFPLWTDKNHELMKAFGIWSERSFMGRKYMGVSRSTFVIDNSGKILAAWEKANPKNHSQEVLSFLKK